MCSSWHSFEKSHVATQTDGDKVRPVILEDSCEHMTLSAMISAQIPENALEVVLVIAKLSQNVDAAS